MVLKKERISVPKPGSSFLRVQCPNCGGEQTVYSSSTLDVKCVVCGSILAQRTGGRARILGNVVRRLD